MRLLVAFILIHLITFVATAQYPEIPPGVQAASDEEMAQAQELSDQAWEKALSIVREDARNGKPYIPWAAKPSDLPQATIPAFPGAKGGGAYSFGGRGGKVFVVTNLKDRGKGSFRWACEQGGARIIVFNVAGVIKLESPVSIRAPYVTIVGNTAPGDGVCITGESVWIDTHDVVIRHMKFRRGATEVARRDDALGGNGVGNIMIDHVSASWGLDENISMYRHVYETEDGQRIKLPTVNITIQNTISSEALDTYNHAFGSTIGGLNCLFYNNLWACNISRNPSIGMYGQFNMVNNVLFNWWNRSVDGGDHRSKFNIVNNYFKPGPITPDEPIAYRLLKPEANRSKTEEPEYGKAYVGGNVTEGYPEVTADNWNGGVQPQGRTDYVELLKKIKVENPFPLPNLEIKSAEESFEYVLANAGATLPKRDAVDKRVVEQVRTGEIKYVEGGKTEIGKEYINRRLPEDSYRKGIITHPSQVGGLPSYEGKPYKDKDKDGMPDKWEKKYGLNPKDASDATGDLSGDGYTNIEKFIYNIDPTKKVDYTDPENNNDTLKY
ncbi:polysaccharide lyase family 1 protein [Marinoscillum sp. MHG1-6]|uniref:pectate lyase family protein n=1 Tax=Marinoscillum sp. MHG1-6 TaxID=2959627 RepID=UPI0021581252|nr:polysaccharide lyase [Marinoscillum sp. MHG1-6]